MVQTSIGRGDGNPFSDVFVVSPSITYSSVATQATGVQGADQAVIDGLIAGELVNVDNVFTVDESGTYAEIVIPEDGNYHIVFASFVQAIASGMLSSANMRFTSQIRRKRSGVSDVDLGSPGDVSMAGGTFSSFAAGSTEAEAVVPLLEDDRIWVTYTTDPATGTTTATIDTQVWVVKLQAGPQGEQGDKGDPGDPGDAVDALPAFDSTNANQVLTVNAAGDDADWETPSVGASSILDLSDTPSAYATDGQVLAVNDDTNGLFLGDIAVALTVTQDNDGLTITATASVE